MNKQWESERSRIEHADDAKITFTIALHGKHAWEMLVEDSHRYHSINHGWATDSPHDWEDTIAPVLRPLFVKGRSGFATKVPWADLVPMYDPHSVAPPHELKSCMVPASPAPQHELKSFQSPVVFVTRKPRCTACSASQSQPSLHLSPGQSNRPSGKPLPPVPSTHSA